VQQVWRSLSKWYAPEGLNEAHNGYIEVYLNLGWVGVGLIALILITGYGRLVAAFRRDPVVGGMWLAYFFAIVFYNITEAGFRLLSTTWLFLLLAIVSAGGVVRNLFRMPQPVRVPRKQSPWLAATSSGRLSPSADAIVAIRKLPPQNINRRD
jgi:O-antigen ligase